MPKSLAKILLLIVLVPLYIYLSGYGIGYFTGKNYQAFEAINIPVFVALVEFLRWSVLGFLVIGFMQYRPKTN
jgi:hypothetical protein